MLISATKIIKLPSHSEFFLQKTLMSVRFDLFQALSVKVC